MYAVGRLGSYISRGVYTVSGPFHPFGGAVDIIVVEQQDGSFKSSPWYVRFGKFQGVLKSREKVVSIGIDGVEADFHMYLDHKGEAYFLREVDSENEDEEEESQLFPLSSGAETDGHSQNNRRRALKTNSFNVDVAESSVETEIDKKVVTGSNSRQSRFMGLFGRKATREETLREEDGDADAARVNSFERAEIVADLLELQWSTNLPTVKKKNSNGSNLSSLGELDGKDGTDLQTNDEQSSDQVVATSAVSESVLEEGCEVITENSAVSEIYRPNSRVTNENCIDFADPDGNTANVVSEMTDAMSPLAYSFELEANVGQEFPVKPISNERDSVLEGSTGPQVNNKENGDQPSLEREMSDSLVVGLDDYGKQAETLCRTTELPTEDTGTEKLARDARLETQLAHHTDGFCRQKNSSCSCTSRLVEDEKKAMDESINCSLQSKLASTDTSKNIYGDSISTEVASVASSGSTEEEQFLIGDLDEDNLDKENHISVHESVGTSYKSYSSENKFVRENPSIDAENAVGMSRVISSPISIPISPKTPGEQVGQLVESMPNMRFHIDDLDNHISTSLPLSHSLEANPKSLKWTLLGEDDNCLNFDKRSEEQLVKEKLNNEDSQTPGELSSSASPDVGAVSFGGEQNFESEGTIAVDRVEQPTEGDPSKSILASNGSWKLWPLSFRRSVSGKAKQPVIVDARILDAELVTTSIGSTDDRTDELRPKRFKEMFRAISPTSEQLASLNLREGRSTITFTFRTGMLGNQQVDASIYLWKWNTRIVISDVDGTITKSDVLGQFMPLVGMDWCQMGVTHLFSAIKENGYQLLFLSARAIAQAYLTRQFLLNIKQDGKALPDGPIVISPDGLFPSLFREVIRRAPHEFKIACLEDIKALFPPDCNPFYAGFGNRDTDEISYRKVGIPKGKIFIINPKGQVAVQRRVDTKSYSNLHDLVHDMFPPTVTEQEDFNSWNFWKLPPPTIDV